MCQCLFFVQMCGIKCEFLSPVSILQQSPLAPCVEAVVSLSLTWAEEGYTSDLVKILLIRRFILIRINELLYNEIYRKQIWAYNNLLGERLVVVLTTGTFCTCVYHFGCRVHDVTVSKALEAMNLGIRKFTCKGRNTKWPSRPLANFVHPVQGREAWCHMMQRVILNAAMSTWVQVKWSTLGHYPECRTMHSRMWMRPSRFPSDYWTCPKMSLQSTNQSTLVHYPECRTMCGDMHM